MISTLDRGGAARRGARPLRARPRPADAAGHRRLAGRPPAQPVGVRGRASARRRGGPGAARGRPAGRGEPGGDRRPLRRRCRSSTGWTSPTPPPTWSCAGPAPPASPRPPRSDCPPSSCRCPIGNGEQEHNARPVVDAGGGLLVADGALTPEWVSATVPALADRRRPARRHGRRGGRPDPARRRRAARADRARDGRRRMRIPVPDELLPADAASAGSTSSASAAPRCPAIARIMAARGVPVTGSDDNDTPFLAGAARARGADHLGYDAAPRPGRGRHPRRHHGRPRGQPGGRRGPAPRAAAAAALGRPGLGDGRPRRARRRRHPRQDHHHLAAHGGAARGRGRPDVRRRRGAARDRAQRRRGAATCSSPRPTRATAPSSSTRPTAAIVTNVEADHLDQWGTEEAYRAAFLEFLDRIDPGGLLVLLRRRPRRGRRSPAPARERGLAVVTVGTERRASTTARPTCAFEGTRSGFTVEHDGSRAGRRGAPDPRPPLRRSTRWRRSRSATGSASTSTGCGRGLGAFTGSGRRMEPKGEAGGVRVYDSYAHHPQRDRRPTSPAARAVAGDGRVRGGLPAAPGVAHPRLRRRDGRGPSAPPTRSSSPTSTSPARTPTPR